MRLNTPAILQQVLLTQRLKEYLAKEQQLKEDGVVITPTGKKVFRDAKKFAEQYGGQAEDWVKKSSTSFDVDHKISIQTHWVENIKTGQRVAEKVKEFVKDVK